MQLPKNLIKRIEEKNAIEGARILVIANKKSGLIQHNKPGGRGQLANVKDGIAWMDGLTN